MRLICPNCGAQYEVPADVIPTGGRDVQCSNCGHTWYQQHPDDDSDLADDREEPLPDPGWDPEPAPVPRRPALRRSPEVVVDNPPSREGGRSGLHAVDTRDGQDDDGRDDDSADFDPSDLNLDDLDLGDKDRDSGTGRYGRDNDDDADADADSDAAIARLVRAGADADAGSDSYEDAYDDDDDSDPRGAPSEPLARRRAIDPSVAEVLRAEAELEQRQREAETLESQPDLGLREPDQDEQARRSRESRERMARIRGDDNAAPAAMSAAGQRLAAAGAAAAAPRPPSRRDLLPDVEEINQTLRSAVAPQRDTRRDDDTDLTRAAAPAKASASGGFGRGFLLIVLLVALVVALYVLAPMIGETVPALAPLAEAYVAQIDALRLWLDTQVSGLLTTLDGMSSEAAGAGSDGN
jgi:predicted Zn finger-like uncharacterized protein